MGFMSYRVYPTISDRIPLAFETYSFRMVYITQSVWNDTFKER